MQRGKKIQDYTGKNEKTKVVVKIQKVRAVSAEVEPGHVWTGRVFVVFDSRITEVNSLFPSERARGTSERASDH